MPYVYGHTAQNLPQPTKPPLAETPDTDEEDTDPCQGSLGIPGLHRSLSVALFPTDGYV